MYHSKKQSPFTICKKGARDINWMLDSVADTTKIDELFRPSAQQNLWAPESLPFREWLCLYSAAPLSRSLLQQAWLPHGSASRGLVPPIQEERVTVTSYFFLRDPKENKEQHRRWVNSKCRQEYWRDLQALWYVTSVQATWHLHLKSGHSVSASSGCVNLGKLLVYSTLRFSIFLHTIFNESS